MNSALNLSRRHFLCAASAGAAQMVIHPLCLQAATKRAELAFVVVTDTHLGYKDQENAEKQWLRTAAEIDRAPGDFVFHLGDIVDAGREAQYPKYLAGRKLIRKPVYEIPGNHDPRDLFQRHIRQEVDAAIEHQWLQILLLNNSKTDSHDGFITPQQIAWLTEQCDIAASSDRLILIAMHVPAHHNLSPNRGWFVKPANGQAEFYALVQQHAARTLALFHGHFHNGLRGWDDRAPVHEVCFPSALYNQDRKLEEKKAPGYNPAEFRPGFTRVSIRDSAMVLEYQPLGVAEAVKKELLRKPT